MTSWSLFRIICLFHACINVVMGSFMVLSISTISRLIHDEEVTKKLHLTDEDEKSRLIQTSESLDGCILIHVLLVSWRIFVEAQVQTLQKDVKGQIIMDLIFAATWSSVLFLNRYQNRIVKNK
ncbi:unnamed protein product [Adineta steineri]|uniref:DUF7865 domain-containing protein n=1 Tax=Adineta steineri TaxID=433720 RepID=A0A818NAU9_9BILA|nr:unnamed protein product [Adineta steineri]